MFHKDLWAAKKSGETGTVVMTRRTLALSEKKVVCF